MANRPNVIVVGGPNGAGKSTISENLLAGVFGLAHYVNADTIARGLSAFHSEGMALKAGKIMLEHLHELAGDKVDFAFETTLASRSFAPWLETLKAKGYLFHLFFMSLPSADHAVERVRERVRTKGHHVPEDTVRRRFERGLWNFFHLYQDRADTWKFYDNSTPVQPVLLARGSGKMVEVIEPGRWSAFCERFAQ